MTTKETEKLLNGIAMALDVGLNGGRKKDMGFVLLVFPFSKEGGEAHCTSNADPEHIPDVLENCAKNLKGRIIRDPENNSRRPN